MLKIKCMYILLCFLKRGAPEQQGGGLGSCPLGEVQALKEGDDCCSGGAWAPWAGGNFWSAGLSRQTAYSLNEREISAELRKQAHNCASETYHSKPLCPCRKDRILQSCFPVWQLSVLSWLAKSFYLVSPGSRGKRHLVGWKLSVLPIDNSFIAVLIHPAEQ